MTKTIKTATIKSTIVAALLLTATAQAGPGLLISDRAAPAENIGILIVGKSATVDRTGILLSDRTGLLISDRSAPAPAEARPGILLSD